MRTGGQLARSRANLFWWIGYHRSKLDGVWWLDLRCGVRSYTSRASGNSNKDSSTKRIRRLCAAPKRLLRRLVKILKGNEMKARILIGDARKRLAELPAGSVRTCITSPPYFGLRDYGTASWDGGDPECPHTGKPMATKANINRNTGGNDVKNATALEFFRERCERCGAMRVDSQMGLEETPEAYVEEMVLLFREVWRVLADDGTLWLNLGDSYGKEKQLQGIPWRVALALQADGWTLRQDIIWAKPNPMPESVTDRCTKSHEYVFLLSKSARYYYDHVAVKEDSVYTDARLDKGRSVYNGKRDGKEGNGQRAFVVVNDKRNRRDVWTIASKPFKGAHFAVMPEALVEPCVLGGSAEGDTVLDPFTGSGTVAVVALQHGRNFVGTELNPEYGQIAKDRITKAAPMFNEVEIV